MLLTNRHLKSTKDDHLVAWFTALAISIHVAESALPSPLPGFKPGLANIVTLVALLLYGWRIAVWVSLLRVLVGSIVIGTFLSPTFFLSFSGAVCSVVVLAIAYKTSSWLNSGLGAIGYGILAALAHMAGQFYAAYILFVPHEALFRLLPLLMTAAMGFGIISGWITLKILQYLDNNPSYRNT